MQFFLFCFSYFIYFHWGRHSCQGTSCTIIIFPAPYLYCRTHFSTGHLLFGAFNPFPQWLCKYDGKSTSSSVILVHMGHPNYNILSSFLMNWVKLWCCIFKVRSFVPTAQGQRMLFRDVLTCTQQLRELSVYIAWAWLRDMIGGFFPPLLVIHPRKVHACLALP